MRVENDYDKEVYNGDIGTIDDVDPRGGIIVRFDGRSVTYGGGELDMLVTAYAATIHKSQGSEYPAVIIPVLTQHYPMLQRIFSTRRHSWQTVGRTRWTEEGHCHCGRLRAAAVAPLRGTCAISLASGSCTRSRPEAGEKTD